MRNKLLIILFIHIFALSIHSQYYYRTRLGLRVGLLNIAGISAEQMIFSSASLTADLSYFPLSGANYTYAYLGLRKYIPGYDNGLYGAFGMGYFNVNLDDPYTKTNKSGKGVLLMLSAGYHFIFGNFSLIPELGYIPYQTLYGSLTVGAAFNYR